MRCRLEADHLDVGGGQQALAAQHRELDDRVGLPGLERHDLRLQILEVRPLDGVELRLAAPPRVVSDIGGARLGVVRLELPRAGAVGRLVERRPRRERLGRDHRLRVVRGHEVWQVAVGVEQGEDDGLGVRRGDRTGLDDTGEARVAGLHEPFERGDDVVGRERRAVLPHHALADAECPHRAVAVRLPRLRQSGRELQVAQRVGEELEALGDGRVGLILDMEALFGSVPRE